MFNAKDKILEAYAGTNKLCDDLINRATDEYFAALNTSGSPQKAQHDIARTAAQSLLKKELLSPASISVVNGEKIKDERYAASIALTFDSVAKPLQIPEPAFHVGSGAFSLALSATVGAILGMVILAPLLRLAFDMPDLGMVLGGPLGAFCAVVIIQKVGSSRFMLRLLRRWRKARYDRQSHELVVRSSIKQWVDFAVPLLTLLCLSKSQPEVGPADKESAFRQIGGLIYALHRTTSESLPVAADELIQAARNCGFEGLEGSPAFLSDAKEEKRVIEWTNDLLSKYEAFGDVTVGDKVRIERKPVVFDGNVMERGLVRKLRDN